MRICEYKSQGLLSTGKTWKVAGVGTPSAARRYWIALSGNCCDTVRNRTSPVGKPGSTPTFAYRSIGPSGPLIRIHKRSLIAHSIRW